MKDEIEMLNGKAAADKFLSQADYIAAAEALGTDVATVRAVAEIESAGSGFLPDGRPKILFEAHVFSRRTNGAYDGSHPEISSAKWNRALYAGGAAEYKRLEEAAQLNRPAALESASWGMFQIMGFNAKRCGFATLQAFINAMYRSEGAQLMAFVAFVKAAGLDDELRRGDMLGFAVGYNGPRQAENHYSEKLYAALARHRQLGAAGERLA